MKKEKIILIGGGGHCKSCIDVIEQEGNYSIAGIIDISEKVGNIVLGYPIIGCDEDLDNLFEEFDCFFITLGQIGSAQSRIKLFNKIKDKGKKIPSIISPLAYVSKHSTIGKGTIVMHNAIINANVNVADNCIINTSALIEHDVIIGSNNHISTTSTVNGGVTIGQGCFIGSKAVIKNNVSIGNDVVIGAGAVVLNDLQQSGVYYGNPAKLRK